MEFKSVEEALNYAIKREIEAARFYTQLSEKMRKREMKAALLSMAEEEKGHRDRLIAIRDGGGFTGDETERKVTDLKIAEFVEMPVITDDLDWSLALVVAMKREKAAQQLYLKMAEAAPDAELRQTFLGLAQEEAGHKLRFEQEYDEVVLEGN
jgi:rubrerythrin